MGNPYDLLVKQDAHITEWSNISTHPDIAHLSGTIDIKNTVTVNASGSVSAGYVVMFNSDGTVSVPYFTVPYSTTPANTNQTPTFYTVDKAGKTYDPINERWAICYPGGGYYGRMRTISLSGEEAFDIHQEITSMSTDTQSCYQVGATYHETYGFVVLMTGAFSGLATYANYGEMDSDGGLTNLEQTEISSGLGMVASSYFDCIYDPVAEKVLVAWAEQSGSYRAFVNSITIPVTGNTVLYDTETELLSGVAIHQRPENTMAYDPVNDVFIMSVEFSYLRLGTRSGGDVVWSDPIEYDAGGDRVAIDALYIPEIGKFAITYKETLDIGYVLLCEYNGSGLDFGNAANIGTVGGHADIGYDPIKKKLVVLRRKTASSMSLTEASISGLTITLGEDNVVDSAGSNGRVYWNEEFERFMILTSHSATQYSSIYVASGSTLNDNNFLGIAQNDALHGESVLVGTLGWLDEQQTGLILPDKYYSYINGTLTTDEATFVGSSSSDTDIIIKR